MSILSWVLKPKKKMAQKGTKRVKIGEYTVSSHAQNRIVDPTRKMTKGDMLNNLFTKPNVMTSVKLDEYGRKSYRRVGKKITTSINPDSNVVTTVRPVSHQEIKKYDLKKNKHGKYYKNRKNKRRK